jgi:spore maturation protein CgeB
VRIAVIGILSGTSLQRINALRRLGHDVRVIDPYNLLGRSRWTGWWLVHTGGAGVGLVIDAWIKRQIVAFDPELVWVDHGAFLGPRLIRSLRAPGRTLVNYMIDDAWSPLHKIRSRHYVAALPYYDLAVVMRGSNAAAARKAGAPHVLCVNQSADEVDHRPRELPEELKKAYASEVAFIGTWYSDRSPFLAELVRLGVPLSIWGDRWQKAPEWKMLAPYWRGPGIYNPDSYAAAIQCAKINLGLLAKCVDDMKTSRTFEIPALGGLLCAERTPEHLALYEEGEEAVFWSDAEECAAVCHALMADEPRRALIAQRGRERALGNGNYNERTLREILALATCGTDDRNTP